MIKNLLTLALIIPVYNEEAHIANCLESIANQTIKPDEVIIVDNNSTDNSIKIARMYDFVTVVHEKKQGIVFARDKGFNSSKSDIIGRIDADTILPINWVAKVKHFYSIEQNENSVLTGGGYFYNVRFPGFNGWVQSQLAYRFNRLIVGFYILWGSNMAFTRKQWLRVMPNVCHDNFIHEDLDLAIHLNRLNYKINYRTDLQVGVYLKRVFENRAEQRMHVQRWPKTLRKHKFKLWWSSIIGNILLQYLVQPVVIMAEYGARIIGK